MEQPVLPADVRAALPTFLVIGAAKAGTTSLHAYLAEHPEIAMTSVKEPMCFEPPDCVGALGGAPPGGVERRGDYRTLFDRLAPVRGESSTAYSAYPYVPEMADRIRAT